MVLRKKNLPSNKLRTFLILIFSHFFTPQYFSKLSVFIYFFSFYNLYEPKDFKSSVNLLLLSKFFLIFNEKKNKYISIKVFPASFLALYGGNQILCFLFIKLFEYFSTSNGIMPFIFKFLLYIPNFFSQLINLESTKDLIAFNFLLFSTNYFGSFLNKIFEKLFSKKNNKFLLYLLFILGADPYQNYLYGEEKIIFNFAKKNKFKKIVLIFDLFGYLVNLTDRDSLTLLHYLAQKGKNEVKYLQILLEKKGNFFISNFFLFQIFFYFKFFFFFKQTLVGMLGWWNHLCTKLVEKNLCRKK